MVELVDGGSVINGTDTHRISFRKTCFFKGLKSLFFWSLLGLFLFENFPFSSKSFKGLSYLVLFAIKMYNFGKVRFLEETDFYFQGIKFRQGPEIFTQYSPPSVCNGTHVMCQVSHVMCPVSHVMCQVLGVTSDLFQNSQVSLGIGSRAPGLYPSSFSKSALESEAEKVKRWSASTFFEVCFVKDR